MVFSLKFKGYLGLQSVSILSVSQLTTAIKQKLESSFAFLSVRGEVSNLRKQASGHMYFTLKDKDAQISAVLFRGNAMRLSRIPKEGDQIVVKGEISVYPPRGNYQLLVREVEFSGTGELLKRLHDLKIKLETLGYFAPEKKKSLPKIPKTIGVITSPTGSVIQDILNVLSRRYSGFHLILNPVRVQGIEAAGEIAQAIKDFNQYDLADVLIIGRGGGSLEDLWPFNEEIVANAIRDSKIPILSAVGHETDFTIADFVADVRAPTPSAAAELVILEKSGQLHLLAKAKTRIVQTLQGHLRIHKRMLEALCKQPVLASPHLFLSPYLQKMDDMQDSLALAANQMIQQHKLRLSSLIKQKEMLKPGGQLTELKENFLKKKRAIAWAASQRIAMKRERLTQLANHLESIDPRNLLKKGYSILFHEKNDSVILSKSAVQENERLRIKVSDGQLIAVVKEKS